MLVRLFLVDWLVFYGISNLVGYIMPNPVYLCIIGPIGMTVSVFANGLGD